MVSKNLNEPVHLIQEAIHKKQINYYEYEHFHNIQKIDDYSAFGKVYRAYWKNSENNVILKSFFKFDSNIVKEILREFELQRETDLYNDVIRLYGITNKSKGITNKDSQKYLLILEYADGSSLRNYLKENFENLNWADKYKLAYQLACAVSCLHDEGIVHRNLHSNNILVHQNNIKLADFGLSKRIKEISEQQLDLFGIVPYTDPKRFIGNNNLMKSYSLNEKSDVYSIGIILWEISSGKQPFESELYDAGLVMQILQGCRETIVPGTHIDYSNLYTECWNSEPDNRPTMNQVAAKLKEIILKPNSEMDIKKIEPTNMPIDLSITIDELVNLILKKLNEGREKETVKENILNYINNHRINSQEVYNWLLNNQNNSNSIYLLGYFNHNGIETDYNSQKAIKLYQKAAELENIAAQLALTYIYIDGKEVDKDNNLAFELSKKLAEKEIPNAINRLGYCYSNGIGTDINKQKAFELFQKATDLGNSCGTYNLAYCYHKGIGTNVNVHRAFKLYQKSADLGYSTALSNLGNFYKNGVGTKVNKKKAFELYQKAADLGDSYGISKLGHCYENGIGTDIDEQKAFELYQKVAADSENSTEINNLGNCYKNGIGTDVDKQKAFELYQKAANLENKLAQYNLALMYENGDGIKEDMERAIYWYKKSAEQGYKYANNKLEVLLNEQIN